MADTNTKGPVDKGKAPANADAPKPADAPKKDDAAKPDEAPKAEPAAAPVHVGTAIPKAPAESVNETFKPSASAQAAQELAGATVKTAAPEHLSVAEGDSPERKQAVEGAIKASAHDVTRPGTPAPEGQKKRTTQVVAAELHEARAKLDDMIRGKNTLPDTDEIKGQRKTVDGLKAQLRDAEGKLATLTGANTKGVNPDDLHAQHYVIDTLERELKGSNPAGK